MSISRRSILSLAMTCVATAALSQASPPPKRVKAPPPPTLKAILKTYVPSGTHSIVVADAQTGKILEASNADKALPPASVAKALTTIYALTNLGSNWQFQTRLVASSSTVSNGILQGDLTLVGGGDPAFDTDGLADLLGQLKARGITGISGKFGVYSNALPYQRTLDRDQLEHVGYNPTISGMNLNFNRVFMKWQRVGGGYDFDLTARTKKYQPKVRGVSVSAVNRKAPVYKYSGQGGRDAWTVAAPALGSKGSRWLPVRNPADYTGEVMVGLALNLGIKLPKHSSVSSAPKGVVLAQNSSANLNAVSKSMLKYSTNLTAETVGLSASVKRGAKPKKVSDSARSMSDWLRGRFGLRSVRMVDHSGLGDASRITGADMTEVLQSVGWNGPLRPLMKPVDLRNANWQKAPIGGVKVAAKTGTLNFTSALAGYLQTASGRKLVFTIFTVDQKARAAIPKSKRDRAPGAKTWARKSRIMQHQLLARWGRMY